MSTSEKMNDIKFIVFITMKYIYLKSQLSWKEIC